jgi:hypothetical protein
VFDPQEWKRKKKEKRSGLWEICLRN